MSDEALSNDARRMLDAMSAEHEPSDEADDRLRARVLAAAASAGVVGVSSTVPSVAKAATPLSVKIVASALVLAGVGATIGVAWTMLDGEEPAPRVQERARAVETPAEEPPREEPGPAPIAAEPVREAAPAIAPRSERRVRVAPSDQAVETTAPAEAVNAIDPVAQEALVVADAQRALRDGRALDALQLVESLPAGALGLERQTIRVLASCELGRIDEARRISAELEQLAPGAMQRSARLARSCAGPSERGDDRE